MFLRYITMNLKSNCFTVICKSMEPQWGKIAEISDTAWLYCYEWNYFSYYYITLTCCVSCVTFLVWFGIFTSQWVVYLESSFTNAENELRIYLSVTVTNCSEEWSDG